MVSSFLFLSCFFLYMRVFHFVIKKKGKGPWDRIPSFFLLFWHFFLNIWILIITSLAIHYSQNVFRGFPILVCIGVQVFFRGFIFHSSSRKWLALTLTARLLPLDQKRKTLKNCACSADPSLINETKDSWFSLSCLSSYQNGW